MPSSIFPLLILQQTHLLSPFLLNPFWFFIIHLINISPLITITTFPFPFHPNPYLSFLIHPLLQLFILDMLSPLFVQTIFPCHFTPELSSFLEVSIIVPIYLLVLFQLLILQNNSFKLTFQFHLQFRYSSN